MERYVVKLMRKYGDGESKAMRSSIIVSDVENYKKRAMFAVKLLRDFYVESGHYTKDEFYGMVKKNGEVIYKFDIVEGDV